MLTSLLLVSIDCVFDRFETPIFKINISF